MHESGTRSIFSFFTTKSRFQNIKLNSQCNPVEKNTHAQIVQMRRILLINEAW